VVFIGKEQRFPQWRIAEETLDLFKVQISHAKVRFYKVVSAFAKAPQLLCSRIKPCCSGYLAWKEFPCL
jgi:hypothetical protein